MKQSFQSIYVTKGDFGNEGESFYKPKQSFQSNCVTKGDFGNEGDRGISNQRFARAW